MVDSVLKIEDVDVPTHKKIMSLKTVRLASTKGHVMIISPGKPTKIPRVLFLEAAKKGCVDYSDEMRDAFLAALETGEPAAALIEAEVLSEDPEHIDFVQLVKEAVANVLIASETDPDLLTPNGVPRMPAVRVALDVLCRQREIEIDLEVTPELVHNALIEVKKLASATELDLSKQGNRYADVVSPGGNLYDDGDGGSLEDLIDRVPEHED